MSDSGTHAPFEVVEGRMESLRERIARSATVAGVDVKSIDLMAVSKFQPVESMISAYRCGIRIFGENRVVEAESKIDAFKAHCPDAQVELLGHLQTNKAQRALMLFDRIQSIDSVKLIETLAERASRMGLRMPVLLEYHTAEASKSGFPDEDSLLRACDRLASPDMRTWIEPCGLMTMAPLVDNETMIRRSFRMCREAFLSIRTRFGFTGFSVLSMGMSGDFELAIQEGSTLIRIGTAIFGERIL